MGQVYKIKGQLLHCHLFNYDFVDYRKNFLEREKEAQEKKFQNEKEASESAWIGPPVMDFHAKLFLQARRARGQQDR